MVPWPRQQVPAAAAPPQSQTTTCASHAPATCQSLANLALTAQICAWAAGSAVQVIPARAVVGVDHPGQMAAELLPGSG